MDDIKREELKKTCKKEKYHKVRVRTVTVRMVLRSICPWMRLQASRYVAPRGSATGCAVTTKEASRVSGIFPDVAGPEEFRETTWMV